MHMGALVELWCTLHLTRGVETMPAKNLTHVLTEVKLRRVSAFSAGLQEVVRQMDTACAGLSSSPVSL